MQLWHFPFPLFPVIFMSVIRHVSFNSVYFNSNLIILAHWWVPLIRCLMENYSYYISLSILIMIIYIRQALYLMDNLRIVIFNSFRGLFNEFTYFLNSVNPANGREEEGKQTFWLPEYNFSCFWQILHYCFTWNFINTLPIYNFNDWYKSNYFEIVPNVNFGYLTGL